MNNIPSIPSVAQFGKNKVHVINQNNNPEPGWYPGCEPNVYYMVCFTWFAPQTINQIKSFPPNRTTFCCNSPKEKKFVSNLGFKAILCAKRSITSSTDVFIPQDRDKIYPVIYNAAMMPWKRHMLAKKIENIAFIHHHAGLGYHGPGGFSSNPAQLKYKRKLKAAFPKAYWLNDLDGQYRYLSPREVAKAINQSSVGLCLSAIEGSGSANVEYLLCGIPVVSTKSLGGRDIFYEPEYSIITEPDELEIQKAVKDIMSDIPPEQIRQSVLDKMNLQQKRFAEAVYDAVGDFDWSAFKRPQYYKKWIHGKIFL